MECEDSDDVWDGEFSALNSALVDALVNFFGESHMVTAPMPLVRPSWRERWPARAQPTYAESLEAPSRHDGFPPCILEFGVPPAAAVRTSDGHPLWHVWLASGVDPESVIPKVLSSGQ